MSVLTRIFSASRSKSRWERWPRCFSTNVRKSFRKIHCVYVKVVSLIWTLFFYSWISLVLHRHSYLFVRRFGDLLCSNCQVIEGRVMVRNENRHYHLCSCCDYFVEWSPPSFLLQYSPSGARPSHVWLAGT